jgi:hypothetical protein
MRRFSCLTQGSLWLIPRLPLLLRRHRATPTSFMRSGSYNSWRCRKPLCFRGLNNR